jgi:hypothetical protein
MPSTATLSTRISHQNSILHPISQSLQPVQATSLKLSDIWVLEIINLSTWKLHRDAFFVSFCEMLFFLSGTGGTLLKHSHHFPDVSLFKDILITNIHSKEHLQLTQLIQINKTIKAVSSYFKLSPHVSLRSAGWNEASRCFLGWRVLIMQTDWQRDTLFVP